MKILFILLVLSFFLVSCSSKEMKLRDSIRLSDIKMLQSKAELYYTDNSTYPDNIDIPIFPVGPNGETCSSGYTYKVNSDNSCFLVSTCLEDENNIKKFGPFDGGPDNNLIELGSVKCFK